MDRIIQQAGAVPLVEDGLESQRFVMVALGRALRAIYGDAASVDGLECVPTVPASMAVIVNPGLITAPATIDASAFGTLPLDTNPCLKVGIQVGTQSFTLAPPQTLGQAINYRLVACFIEVDDTPTVAPYYNAANPAQPFSGPGGGGAAVNRYRRQKVGLEILAGAPATVGQQASPAVPPGYVPLYTITVSNGQQTITSANIVQDPASPVAQFRLPQLTPGFSRMLSWGSAGTYTFIVPNGVYQARVRVLGAGAGGAASNPGAGGDSNNYQGGAGGGSGGYAECVVALAPGEVITVTVGAGGVGGVAAGCGVDSSCFGGNGGTSSFGAFAASTGGQGGYYTDPLFGPGGAGGLAYLSGNGIPTSGGYGADGQDGYAVQQGNGAGGFYGAGGRAGNGYGLPGIAPGSGGGGCYSAVGPGGRGADGLIIVEF